MNKADLGVQTTILLTINRSEHFHIEGIGDVVRLLSRKKSKWRTRNGFIVRICDTYIHTYRYYECPRQRQRQSTHLCLSQRTRPFLSSMFIFQNSIFERFSLTSVETFFLFIHMIVQ